MSLKARIIDSVAMIAVALIALKLMTTVHLPPSVSAPLSTLAHVLFAAMALIWILSAFINAEQEAGGEKRPAFLAAGATLAAILSLLIRSRVVFQTAPQAYGAFGISAAMLLLAGVCFWQLQGAVRRGMPKTARSYMAAAFFAVDSSGRNHAEIYRDCVDAISAYGVRDRIVCADRRRIFLDEPSLGADCGRAGADVGTGACKMKQNESPVSRLQTAVHMTLGGGALSFAGMVVIAAYIAAHGSAAFSVVRNSEVDADNGVFHIHLCADVLSERQGSGRKHAPCASAGRDAADRVHFRRSRHLVQRLFALVVRSAAGSRRRQLQPRSKSAAP